MSNRNSGISGGVSSVCRSRFPQWTRWLSGMAVCASFLLVHAANGEQKNLPIKNKASSKKNVTSARIAKNNGSSTITAPAGATVKFVPSSPGSQTGEWVVTGLNIPPGGQGNFTFNNPDGTENSRFINFDYKNAKGQTVWTGKCNDPISYHVVSGGPGGDFYLGYPIPSGQYGYFYQMFPNSTNSTTVLQSRIYLGPASGAYNFQVLNNSFPFQPSPGFDLDDIQVPLRDQPNGYEYEILVPYMDPEDATGVAGIPTVWTFDGATGVATMDFTGAGGLGFGQTGSLVAFTSPYPPTALVDNVAVDYLGGVEPPCMGTFAPDALVPLSPDPPEYTFHALPELPGGSSEAFSVYGFDGADGVTTLSVGHSLDADSIWKAVAWQRTGVDPWQIQSLPNPFGNTESTAFAAARYFKGTIFYSIGGGSSTTPTPRPVAWVLPDGGVWTAEVPPLPLGFDSGQFLATDSGNVLTSATVPFVGWVSQGASPHHAVLCDMTTDGGGWTSLFTFLPDQGPGFPSEALCVVHDNIFVDDVHIGGAVGTESSPMAPCVWEPQSGGGFNRIELPMSSGAYLGSVTGMEVHNDGEFYAVGYDAQVAGLADLYRGVLYRRINGVWSDPLELPPLSGMRDSRATSVVFPINATQGVLSGPPACFVLGYSYVEPLSNSERATLWEIAPDDTIIAYDLNDQSLNLPPGVTLALGSSAYARDLPDSIYGIAGAFVHSDSPSTPHAYVLGARPPSDPFTTIDLTQVAFGAPDSPPIPADFFYPGSEPFFGTVQFEGGCSDLEDPSISARVQRDADVVCPGSGIPRLCNPIPLEIVSLDLVSVSPITVNGPTSTTWNVQMGLSQVPAAQGSLGLNLEHANGGTYGCVLPMLPSFTFTNVDNPNDVRVLDYGDMGNPDILVQFSSVPWVAALDAQLAEDVFAPSDGNFVPLVQEQLSRGPGPQTAVSATGTSTGGGFTHTIGLARRKPRTPLADPSGKNKVRFISFSVPGAAGSVTALRVNLVSLHHVVPPYSGAPSIPFTAFEGQSVWVGPPSTFLESSASQIPFKSARTQCTPFYHNWTTVGLIHVRGSAIVPSSIYKVENVSLSCQGNETSPPCQSGGAKVSGQLTITTNRWGDVESPFNPPSPTAQPDLADVGALVNKFRGAPGAPIKARAIIQSNDQFGNITDAAMSVDFGFSHIAACVDAFRGQAYPAKMGRCSGAGTAACTTAADCTTGGNTGPCNLNCQ